MSTVLGNRLKELRSSLKMTQADVAKSSGISERTYLSYEKGSAVPKNKNKYTQLASALNTDPTELMQLGESSAEALQPVGFGLLNTLSEILSSTAIVTIELDKPKKDVTVDNIRTIETNKRQSLAKFASMALGVIYGGFVQQGISISPGSTALGPATSAKQSISFLVSHPVIKHWEFHFIEMYNEWDRMFDHNDTAWYARTTLTNGFPITDPDPTKKYTVVVHSKALYSELVKYQGHNALKLNLSVLYIDTDQCAIKSESYVSLYDDNTDITTFPNLVKM